MFKRINRNIQAFAVGVCIAATGILIADDASAADFRPYLKSADASVVADVDSLSQIAPGVFAVMIGVLPTGSSVAQVFPTIVDCKRGLVQFGSGKEVDVEKSKIVGTVKPELPFTPSEGTLGWHLMGDLCGKPA